MPIIVYYLILIYLLALISERLERSVITVPMVLTIAGILYAFFVQPASDLSMDVVLMLAEAALVLILFTEATTIDLRKLSRSDLPARLLGIGMPLTIGVGLVCAALLFPNLTIWEAGILATILAPTDAGLGEAVVSNPLVPERIRRALSLEGGLNDGLALPFLMLFIALAISVEPESHASWPVMTLTLIGVGILIGAIIGGVGGWILNLVRRRGWAANAFVELALLSLGLLCFYTAEHLGGSGYIAAFVGGMALRLSWQNAGDHFAEFANTTGKLLNYLVFLLLGVLAGPILGQLDLRIWLFALLALTLARILPVAIALYKSGMSRPTVWFMGWFGPRGLASIVLGLVYIEHELHLPGTQTIQMAVIATVLLSVFAHGFTANPGAKWYAQAVARLGKDAPELKEAGDRGAQLEVSGT